MSVPLGGGSYVYAESPSERTDTAQSESYFSNALFAFVSQSPSYLKNEEHEKLFKNGCEMEIALFSILLNNVYGKRDIEPVGC